MAGNRRRTLYPLDPSSYRILGEIGGGASAVVYKAVCLPLGSAVVAIKSIDLDRSRPKLDDARREATAMTLLSHPNILASHCSFTVGRRLWVVMPLMAAGSLRSVISSSFPDGLPEAPVAVVLREVLCALSYLHGQGHVHRDIKAGNILLDSDGSVKLADFGVSASIYDHSSSSASSSTSFREMAGTPYWMAPEVIRSHDGYGVKADIWSFGVTALELAHGRPPLSHLPLWKSLVIRIANHLQNDDRKKKKKLSKTFKDMVSSCLAHDPTKRPSADHLLRHPFFKNCKTTDYLVKNVLHVVPSVVEGLKEEVMPTCCDDAGASSSPDAKIRRISGWNFNEDKHKHRQVSFGGEEIIHKEVVHRGDEDVTKESVGHDKSLPALKETLVPSLVSLLSSLEVQQAMVMDVLTHCGGGEDGVHDLRERQLLGFMLTLQRVVDDLDIQPKSCVYYVREEFLLDVNGRPLFLLML